MKSLLLAMVLVLSPASAFAACAWVQWGETTKWGYATLDGRSSDEWQINDVYDTRARCDAAAKDVITKNRAAHEKRGLIEGQRVKYGDTWVYSSFYEKDNQTPTGGVGLRLYCLPDTVDPRAPKGA